MGFSLPDFVGDILTATKVKPFTDRLDFAPDHRAVADIAGSKAIAALGGHDRVREVFARPGFPGSNGRPGLRRHRIRSGQDRPEYATGEGPVIVCVLFQIVHLRLIRK
jgi:hypothetical protein